MFRELDERESNGITITLEWDDNSGQVRLRFAERPSSWHCVTCVIDPANARRHFDDPFTVLPIGGDQRPGRVGRQGSRLAKSKLLRYRFRLGGARQPAEPSNEPRPDIGHDIWNWSSGLGDLGSDWL